MPVTRKSISVAGRLVSIRHATAWDLDTIRRESTVREKDLSGIDPEQVVVAAEEDTIIGFGIVGSSPSEGTVCVTVFEKQDRRNIGASIVRHVLENEPKIRALRESFDLPEHDVKMVVARRPRGSAEAGSWACSVFEVPR